MEYLSNLIIEVDDHFPNKIAIRLKGPYYFHEEFVPDKLFSKIPYMRDKKISQILS